MVMNFILTINKVFEKGTILIKFSLSVFFSANWKSSAEFS